MYYVQKTERNLWTVGSGEGRDWNPVEDHSDYWHALEGAERLNNPQTYKKLEAMQQQLEALQKRLEEMEESVSEMGSQSYLADVASRYR